MNVQCCVNGFSPPPARDIEEGFKRAKKRKQFTLKLQWAVRPIDVRRAMLELKPETLNIIHFCGHGEGEEGIAFEDDAGYINLVKTAALSELFELFATKVKCVLLNACYTEIQAKAIAQHIDYVIGMRKSIGDKAAIEFAVAFYDALGAGEDIEFAYKLGCNALSFLNIPRDQMPALICKADSNRTLIIPKPITAILLKDIDASEGNRLRVPDTEDLYSSYQPIADKECFFRIKTTTTPGWIPATTITSAHQIIPNETYTSSGIQYQKIKNAIYIIKDPIRPFETQIGISRSQRPGGTPGTIAIDSEITIDEFKQMYPFVLMLEKHRNWMAMVLAEIIPNPEVLQYMYDNQTDQTVKKLISKNPFAPKPIQETECFFVILASVSIER